MMVAWILPVGVAVALFAATVRLKHPAGRSKTDCKSAD